MRVFLIMQKPIRSSLGTASNPLSLRVFHLFSMDLTRRICRASFGHAFAATSVFYKVSLSIFWFLNCELKISISAKNCISSILSLIGCIEPIDTLSCTYPVPRGSSMLCSTLTDRSFSPSKRFILPLEQFF